MFIIVPGNETVCGTLVMPDPSDCSHRPRSILLFPKPSRFAVPLRLLFHCTANHCLVSPPQGPVEHVQLLTPFVVIRNKEVNITALVLPSHSRTVTYFWWLGNNTEVILPRTQFQIVHTLCTQLYWFTLMKVRNLSAATVKKATVGFSTSHVQIVLECCTSTPPSVHCLRVRLSHSPQVVLFLLNDAK